MLTRHPSDPAATRRAGSGLATARRLLIWLGSGMVAAATTGWALARVITTFGRQTTGMDFWNNTWRAVRGLLSGINIYGPAHVSAPGIGPGWPVSPHVPGSLVWQAPFAALPLRAAVFTYASVSILAIWAALLILVRPRTPGTIFLTACCGAMALCGGAGLITLLLGQPTGFALLGLALVVRARRPWLAGLGFMLAATTIQTGLPLGIALLLLGGWPTVWRGATLLLTTSIPPLGLEVANAGLHGTIRSFTSTAAGQLGQLFHRIDLGALLERLGVTSVAVQVGAGLLVAVLALAVLARLPMHRRRIGYPPVLCLVIAFTLLCTYHEPYDLLLVSGALVPVILVDDGSRAMLPMFALAGLSAALTRYNPAILNGDVIALLAIAAGSALVARRAAVPGAGAPGGRAASQEEAPATRP